MGCSTSMSVPVSEKPPLDYPQVFHNNIPLKSEESVNSLNNNHNNRDCDTQKDSDIQINSTQILIISQDHDRNDSTDSSSIIPLFDNDEPSRKASDTLAPCLKTKSEFKKTNSARTNRAMSLPGSIKSVLKTGHRDTHSHLLANRPIKTVTFVDSVTVVTVY